MKISCLHAALFASFGLCSLTYADPINLNSGLVASFAFSGNTLDSSGNGNDASIVGNLSYTTDRFGNANSALQFRKNGYVQINNSTLLNGATSGAITGWFNNQLGPNETGFVIGAGDARAGLDPFALYFGFNTTITQSIFTQTTRGPSDPDRLVGNENPAAGITVPQDVWTSFVMQFTSIGNTSFFQFYLNGQLAQSYSYDYSFQVNYDQPMPVQIGALTGFQDVQFRGDIDDVRFYDRALNGDEIAALSSVADGGSTGVYVGMALVGLMMAARRPKA
jgi:hypothetical protein